MKKDDGDESVADLGSKHVDGKRMLRHLGDMGIVTMTGRSEQSLRVSGQSMV